MPYRTDPTVLVSATLAINNSLVESEPPFLGPKKQLQQGIF